MKVVFRLYRWFVYPFLHALTGVSGMSTGVIGCRHEPSCSHYAERVLREEGFLRGGWLAVKRLLRCQSFSKASFDPKLQSD